MNKVFFLFCFNVPLFAQGLGGQKAVDVFVKFEKTPPMVVRAALSAEAERIMAGVGVRLVWRSLDELDATSKTGGSVARTPFSEVAYVTFKGSCTNTDGAEPHGSKSVGGRTDTGGGEILSSATIACDEIRNTISPYFTMLRQQIGDPAWGMFGNTVFPEQKFGRAVGRVLAHELYHILAKTGNHEESGVAKDRFSTGDLVADKFNFRHKALTPTPK